MPSLKVANIHFDITGSNRIEYLGDNVVRVSSNAVKLPVGTTSGRPPGEAGLIRYNSETGSFEGYNASSWGAIGGGGSSSVTLTDNVQVISANTNADAYRYYVFTANNIYLQLPGAPVSGDWVRITNPTAFTNSWIAANGKPIMALSQNLTIDIANTGFTLTYTDATRGWTIT